MAMSVYVLPEMFDFPNNKASFGPENKKIVKKFLVLKLVNFRVKLRNF